jgi:hypothetical protein
LGGLFQQLADRDVVRYEVSLVQVVF